MQFPVVISLLALAASLASAAPAPFGGCGCGNVHGPTLFSQRAESEIDPVYKNFNEHHDVHPQVVRNTPTNVYGPGYAAPRCPPGCQCPRCRGNSGFRQCPPGCQCQRCRGNNRPGFRQCPPGCQCQRCVGGLAGNRDCSRHNDGIVNSYPVYENYQPLSHHRYGGGNRCCANYGSPECCRYRNGGKGRCPKGCNYDGCFDGECEGNEFRAFLASGGFSDGERAAAE